MQHVQTHPAHLYIGPEQSLVVKAEYLLQTLLCTQNGCTYCTTCLRIHQRQHAQLLWIQPEKQYTLEDIQPIFDAVSFARTSQEPFYMVIQRADYLTSACANALLKIVEEPPVGYHFIFLASSSQAIPITLRSRCILDTQSATADTWAHNTALFKHFAHVHMLPPIDFLHTLDTTEVTERESVAIIDTLLMHWYGIIKQGQNTTRYAQAMHIAGIIEHAAKHPPMPGSSKLFWKNLFLQLF